MSGWLLEKWQFPDRTQQVVAASHDPERIPKQSPNGVFARCVALASMIAEVFLDNTGERGFLELAERAHAYLAIDKEVLGELLAEIGQMIPDAESIFGTEILKLKDSEAILEEARDALMLRNLQALQIVDNLKTQHRVARATHAKTRGVEQTRSADESLQPQLSRRLSEGRVRDQQQGGQADERRVRGPGSTSSPSTTRSATRSAIRFS